MTRQLIPLSQPGKLETAGAGVWNIENIVPNGVDTDLVGVNTELLKRWSNYLIGLGDLAVETAPDSAFQGPEDKKEFMGKEMVTSSKGVVSYSPTDLQLPSTYRRPHGKIIFNESEFCKEFKDEDSIDESAETKFVRQLDRSVRGGLVNLAAERYGKPQSMVRYERSAGLAPYITSGLSELAGVGTLAASGIFAALYAVALGADYHGARLALGKGASLGALKLKRWSITPCGMPVERHTELNRIISKNHET